MHAIILHGRYKYIYIYFKINSSFSPFLFKIGGEYFRLNSVALLLSGYRHTDAALPGIFLLSSHNLKFKSHPP